MLVEGDELLILALTPPDPRTSIFLRPRSIVRADAIVNYNLRDFPAEVAAPCGIEVKHPDDFNVNVIDLDTGKALTAIGNSADRFATRRYRRRLSRTLPRERPDPRELYPCNTRRAVLRCVQHGSG